MSPTARIVLPLLAMVLITGCAQGLAFREDKRVVITSPGDRELVRLPLTVAWTVRDFEVVPPDGSRREDRGRFALFVDRTPMPPGKDLRWLARDDEQCLADPRCPSEAWLASRGVHLTTATSFRIENLPDTRPVNRPGQKDRHEVTIVLLNGRGERIGESAFAVEFFVDRRG